MFHSYAETYDVRKNWIKSETFLLMKRKDNKYMVYVFFKLSPGNA